jgi:hypothetical protein
MKVNMLRDDDVKDKLLTPEDEGRGNRKRTNRCEATGFTCQTDKAGFYIKYLSINFFTMPDFDYFYNQFITVNRIYHAVITYSKAIMILK